MQRLECALERLLISVGSEVDPTRRQVEIEEEEESESPQEETPARKRSAEDNKLVNTMSPQKPITVTQDESPDLEREIIDSYAEEEQQESSQPVEEVIDIVKQITFDPNHPGLINLSPMQISDLE